MTAVVVVGDAVGGVRVVEQGLDAVTSAEARADWPATGVPAEPGIWVVVFGDLAVFATLFVMFLVDDACDPAGFSAGRASMHLGVGAVNTLVLVTSSLAVVIGVRALRSRRRGAAVSALSVAMAFGVVFVGLKVVEYALLWQAGRFPAAGRFYMWYFVLTGFHLAHVIAGLAVLALVRRLAQRHRCNRVQVMVAEAGACFWHLVDVLWVFLLPQLYLAG